MQDAAVVILGFQFTRVEIVYSYDFTVSRLGPASGGAHEVALKYRFEIQEHGKSRKKDKFIPCPYLQPQKKKIKSLWLCSFDEFK